jgi:hypothetical protein
MARVWPESLQWQHFVTAQCACASVGLISKELLALAVEINEQEVVLHAVLARSSREVIEDLDEMCFDLDVLLDGHTRVSHQESVGFDASWPAPGTVPIYLAKGARGG